MGMAHRRSIGAVRNKRIVPGFSTASSWKTRPHQGQHPRPHRLQVCTPWTLRNSLGVLGAAAVQQSGAEGFDQKTRTASSHRWKAELQSFQKALTGDKSGCLKFLGGRFAPTQTSFNRSKFLFARLLLSLIILLLRIIIFILLFCNAIENVGYFEWRRICFLNM